MADGPGTAVQRALVVALRGANVAGGRIYAQAPQDPAHPFVALQEMQLAPFDSMNTVGFTLTIAIRAYARPVIGTTGRRDAGAVLDAIRRALHRRPESLDPAGFRVVDVLFETEVVRVQGDGQTYEGAAVYRVIIQPK